MANRRMFSLKVVDTDIFLDMSASAQNLYFHLGMRADDDGFISSPKKIMVMCNASEDDMKVLLAKNFVIKMATNGVSVVTHWHTNNLIRPDRYQATEYKEEKARLEIVNGKYSANLLGIPNGNHLATQDRLGKVSIGKDRLGKDKNTNTSEQSSQVNKMIEFFKDINPSYQRLFPNKTQRAACERMLKKSSLEKLGKIIENVSRTNQMKYSPTITTPIQLEDKMGQLIAFLQKENNNQPLLNI